MSERGVRGNGLEWYFLAGLLLSGLFSGLTFASFNEFSVSTPILLLSGFLVGFGSSFGNGCTSGHGVCGIGRLSLRSIVATCVFMSVAFVVCTLLASNCTHFINLSSYFFSIYSMPSL